MKPEANQNQVAPSALRRFRIGDALISERYRTVSIGDKTHTLTDLTWRFLLALIEAAPGAVNHESLGTRVWENKAVSDETIAQRVRQLRIIFGDNPKDPAYIRTIRGGGYQLMPPVEEQTGSAAEIATPGTPKVRWIRAGIFTATVALAATLWWISTARQPEKLELPNTTPEIGELLERAHEYRARAQYAANEVSIELYEEVLNQQPENTSALIGLSLALSHRSSKYEESMAWATRAAEYADQALLLDPDNGDAWAARGLADDARGRVSNAIKYYQRAFDLDGDNYSLLADIAYLRQIQGRLHEALVLEADALKNAPPSYFADYQIAIALELAGLKEESNSWMQRAERLRPDNVFLMEYKAGRHIADGRNLLALALLEGAGQERFGHMSLRGVALLGEGRIEEALQAFSVSQELARTKERDCFPCVAAMAGHGDQENLEHARKLLSISRDWIQDGEEWPGFRVELAYLHAALADQTAAIRSLEEAFELGYLDWRSLESSPLLSELHDRSDFQTLLARMQQRSSTERQIITGDASLAPLLGR